MAIVRKQGDWLIAKMGDERVMMSREKVHHIAVSEVGARIWELIGGSADMHDICAQLCREYAVDPDVCRAEVDAFVGELAGHGAARIEA